MVEHLRAVEAARAEVVHALKRLASYRGAAERLSHEIVDEVVSALLLGHVGALSTECVADIVKGERALDALRTVARSWWVWRPSPLPFDLALPAGALRAVGEAVAAWVRTFDGTPADVLLAYHEARLALDRDARRDKGAFYTPPSVAAALVAESLRLVSRRPGKPPRVLDPACGTGVFLVAAFRHLAESQLDQPMEGALARRLALAAATLHGVDLDARAVDLARRAVLLTVLDDPRVQEELALALTFPATAAIQRAVAGIVHGDALLGEDAPAALMREGIPAVHWAQTFSSAFAAGGFDLVIGNPPFASFGGREARALDPSLRAYLEARHGAFRWPALHGWFLATAARLWARDLIAFVLPEQLLHLDGYGDVRAVVDDRFEVQAARLLDNATFGEAVAPTATVIFRRRAEASETAGGARGPWIAPSRPQALARILERGTSLRGWFIDCGVRTTSRATQVRRIAAAHDDGHTWVPVLEGKDIGLWRTEPPRVAVRLGAGVHVAPTERYERVSYVVRQTAAYPICARKLGALHFRNSLLGVTTPASAPCDVRYVVAFLNSRLGRYLYATLVQESAQRVFPQVKLGALARLPIRMPVGDDERARHDRIVELAEARFALAHDDATAQELEASIDAAIDAMHEVDDVLREAIALRLATMPLPP